MVGPANLQLLTLLGLGFILGLEHAFDADHVIAVSTLVSQTKSLKKSSLLGAIWGFGHTVTLFLAGFLILVFKLTIPGKLALSFEFLVGIVLVLLGLDVLRKFRQEKIHFHEHQHDNFSHLHPHSHRESENHHHRHKSFMVGMLHGLAGSAALALLILTTVKSIFQGLLYILVFGIGSILGMLGISTLLGLPFLLTAKFDKIHGGVRVLVGVTSIVLGFSIISETVFLFIA